MSKQMQSLIRYGWMAQLIFAGALAGCQQNGATSLVTTTTKTKALRATFVVYTLRGDRTAKPTPAWSMRYDRNTLVLSP